MNVMAPNIKVARAYKAMKAFGYSSQIVKPVLKNLLDLYDQNWELIEDEKYKVLLDAVIESGKHKKKEESHSVDEPKMKLKRAYKTMKTLGYSQHAVEPVLKSLLELYDQNWQLIEDEDYRVLIDAIFDNEETKREKKTPQKFDISDKHQEDSPPGRRYSLRNHTLRASPPSGHSSPSFSETTVKSPGSNGKQKLTDSACCVGDTILEYPLKNHQKAERVNSQHYYSEAEFIEKIELLPRENINESDPRSAEILISDGGDIDYFGSIIPKQVTDDPKRIGSVSWEEKNFKNKSNLSMQKNDLDKNHAAATSETQKSPDDHSEFRVPLAVILPDCSGLKFNGCNSSKDYFSNSEEAFLTSPEVIHLEAEDKYGCSPGGHCLECKCLVSAEEKNHSLNPSRLDIASSSSGEVKISMMYKSSHGSNFCTPSLEAVSKKMQEDFLESYGLRQPGFSLEKFMKDVCECFLAAGTITADNNRVRPGDFLTDPGTPRKINPQDVLNGRVNHEKGLVTVPNISSEALKVLRLVKVAPEIPRLQGLSCLDFSCCKIDLMPSGAYGTVLANLSPSLSNSMMIVQKQIFSHDMLSFTYHVEDISRGEEDLKVSLINEFNDECQPNFKYIRRNINYQNAFVKFSLALVSNDNCCPNCFGNCLSSEIPCACASETGGDFSYTHGGLVKEKFLEDCISLARNPQQKNLFYCEDCPLDRSKNKGLSGKCKGHILRKFIKECWYKCGCGMECSNRVVQRGIKVKLQVFMTPEGKGWGLRTLEDLPKGAFVCEYVGEVVTNIELYERNMRSMGEKHSYPVLLDADWGTEGVMKDEEALCLDATFFGNIARFINHRCCDSNLVEIPVEVETPDHHYYHLAFFTTRKINALEELTWDYGIDFDDDTHPVKAFHCSCGSQFCREVKPLKRRRTER